MHYPLDQDAREQALNVQQSFIVRAPAGSGKTTLLVRRYFRLLLEVADPQEICITTFAIKATQDIQHRIQHYLTHGDQGQHDAAWQELLQQVRARWQEQQWAFSSLRICTLDALAYTALLRPSQMVGQAAPIYRAAIGKLFQALTADPGLSQHMHVLAAVHQWRYPYFTGQLMELLANRGAWLHLLEQSPATLSSDYESLIVMLLTTVQQRLNHPLLLELTPSFSQLKTYQQLLKKWFKKDGYLRKGRQLPQLPEAYQVALILAAVEDSQRLYGPAYQSMLAILRYLQNQTAHLLKTQGVIDFPALYGDQEYRSLHLTHLLIDEFQDVSRAQYGFLQAVCATMEPPTATVFIVGDPLQSIYQFRQAELSLFFQTILNGLGPFRLQYLQLTCNFRARQPLVTQLNHLYAQLLPTTLDPVKEQLGFLPTHAIHHGAAQVILKQYRQQAGQWRAIIQILQRFLTQSPQQTLCILVRSRAAVHGLLPLLAQANIPIKNFLRHLYDEPLLKNLSLCWFLAHQPTDLRFWRYLMLSDFFTLTLAEIQQLDLTALASEAPPLLQAYTALFFDPTLPLAGKLATIWHWHHKQEDPELLSSFQQIVAHLAPGPHQVQDAYQDLITQLQRTPILLAQAKAGITLATIHSVKGLEFDAIILPEAQRSPRKQAELLKAFTVVTPTCTLELSYLHQQHKPHPLLPLQRVRTIQSAIRLMYVALTRAKRLIIITAGPQGTILQDSFRYLFQQGKIRGDV